MFKFQKYYIPECEQINSASGRTYKTPNGDIYPSVSTVLGSISNPELEAWKLVVGKEEAQRISNQATFRGAQIHSWCENYIKGIPFKVSPFYKGTHEMYLRMIPYLNQFTLIHGIEQRMWSDSLKVAGTADCIATIGEIIFLVDFKTSKAHKNRNEIDSYFMQCAAYARMFYERTGVLIKFCRVIITTEDNGVLVYDEPILPWLKKFMEIRSQYK